MIPATVRPVARRATAPTPELTAALGYAARGWPIFPVTAEKQPLTPHGFLDASSDVERVRSWWQAHPSAGIGWALPRALLVLDVDARHRGHESLDELQARHAAIPPTLSQQTGGGGLHLVFRIPHGVNVRQTAGELGAGLDTRVGGRGYIVLPPSAHTSGQRYRWLEQLSPAEAPSWLIGLLTTRPSALRAGASKIPIRIEDRYAAAVLAGEAREVASTPEGGRNHRLCRAWFRCTRDLSHALDRELVRQELVAAAIQAGLSEHEAMRVCR